MHIKTRVELNKILKELQPQKYSICVRFGRTLFGHLRAEYLGLEKTYWGKNGWCRVGDSTKADTFRMIDILYIEFTDSKNIRYRFEAE